MATEAQIEANRLNALKSTGAVTPAGKATVSQNRRTHGLCGKFRVHSCESQEMFDSLVAGLMEAEQPANDAEIQLVIKMAQHTWMANRALQMQENCFEPEELDEDEDGNVLQPMALDVFRLQTAMRYHTMHDRAYQRAAKELMERRKQRQLAEIGFERKKAAEAHAQRKEADAKRIEAESQRKAEKHQTDQEIANLKKQALEIRVAKRFMSELNKIKSPHPVREQEFYLTEAKSAA